MHGIIYNQLYKFIRENHGFQKLNEIRKEAGIDEKFYDATKSHPDDEIQSIINASSKVLGVDRPALLEAFGGYITPGLIKTYGAYIKPEWDCMDLLEHVEKTIHKVVRHTTPEAAPPILTISRTSPNEVNINYTSQRNMVGFGVGIIKELANHYKQKISINMTKIPDGTRLQVIRA